MTIRKGRGELCGAFQNRYDPSGLAFDDDDDVSMLMLCGLWSAHN